VAGFSSKNVVEDVEGLDQGQPAGTWWRRGIDVVASELGAQRFAHDRTIVGQVFAGEEAAAALRLLHQAMGQ
jgi:hypothetical protein